MVLPESQSSNTNFLRDGLERICDWSHDLANAWWELPGLALRQ